jgi:hypothetical protein
MPDTLGFCAFVDELIAERGRFDLAAAFDTPVTLKTSNQ